MKRYIALLRAINVGRRTVTNDRLREQFEALGFKNVETFIASGNVIFETNARSIAALEKRISDQLEAGLGFDVVVFVRSDAELQAIAEHPAFDVAAVAASRAYCVGVLAAPLSDEQQQALQRMKTEVDDFHVNGREVYWLCATKQSESTFSNAAFERALKARTTFRNLNTIQRLTTKYPPSQA
jgi:uncharacterized protein (DUF1697 family)